MMRGFTAFLFLLFINISLQDEPPCTATCTNQRCPSVCYGSESVDETLCTCTQVGTDGPIGCKDPEGVDCTIKLPTPFVTVDATTCKTIWEDNPEAIAYTYKHLALTDENVCILLKVCKSYSDVPHPGKTVEKETTVGEKKCQSCPQLEFIPGPTSIHWSCGVPEDPYLHKMGTGTICHRTQTCSGTEEEKKATLTCKTNPVELETVGQWQDKDSNEVLPDAADQECDCPTLAIAAESGTSLSCTEPVSQTDGFYILNVSNTCLLTCDGYYVMSMRCAFSTNADGTQWVKDDDTAIEAENNCLSCWEGGCEGYSGTNRDTILRGTGHE